MYSGAFTVQVTSTDIEQGQVGQLAQTRWNLAWRGANVSRGVMK